MKWGITRQCRNCLNFNTLYETNTVYAWECWCCAERFWISDEERQMYADWHLISVEEADEHLDDGEVPVTNGLTGV